MATPPHTKKHIKPNNYKYVDYNWVTKLTDIWIKCSCFGTGSGVMTYLEI